MLRHLRCSRLTHAAVRHSRSLTFVIRALMQAVGDVKL